MEPLSEQIAATLGVPTVPAVVSCDNCSDSEHTLQDLKHDPCAVLTMVRYTITAGLLNPEEAMALLPKIDALALWDAIDRLLVQMIDGQFNTEE